MAEKEIILNVKVQTNTEAAIKQIMEPEYPNRKGKEFAKRVQPMVKGRDCFLGRI